MKSRILATAGLALSAALFLSACADTEEDTPTVVTTTATQAETTTATEDTVAEDTVAETTVADDAASDADPVFDAIGAVLTEYQGGIILSIDREDRAEIYDVDVVLDGRVIELEVNSDGSLREEEREGDRDDVREAESATLTAEEAIRQALDQYPDGVLDEAQLEEDDGSLHWEISLDDADRTDLAEVRIAAN